MKFFLNSYIIYAWMKFFLWENAFIECMKLFSNAYMMYVWMNFFYEKMYAWCFFSRIFFFEYEYMHKKSSFFENAYMNGIFRNAYTMYEILKKCIRDFVNNI